MKIKFEKWQGCLNDFIVIWVPEDKIVFKALQKAASNLCNRVGNGIGADGLIIIHYSESAPLVPTMLKIINSDGSLATTCGNGIRCAASSARSRHLSEKATSPEGILFPLIEGNQAYCQFMGQAKTKFPLVSVDMGKTKIDKEADCFDKVQEEVKRITKQASMPEMLDDFSFVQISNEHLVFFMPNISREVLLKIGPLLQNSEIWDGINVHLVKEKTVTPQDSNLANSQIEHSLEDLFEVLVWERGAGETKACGSGACAVAAAAYKSGFISRSNWIGIDMPGGRLYLRQPEKAGAVTMAGPAEKVFDGTFDL